MANKQTIVNDVPHQRAPRALLPADLIGQRVWLHSGKASMILRPQFLP